MNTAMRRCQTSASDACEKDQKLAPETQPLPALKLRWHLLKFCHTYAGINTHLLHTLYKLLNRTMIDVFSGKLNDLFFTVCKCFPWLQGMVEGVSIYRCYGFCVGIRSGAMLLRSGAVLEFAHRHHQKHMLKQSHTQLHLKEYCTNHGDGGTKIRH